jgi:hypothetical protein
MGLKLFSSSSYDNYGGNTPIVQPPNPDPAKFKILWKKQYGELCILHVKYEGCTSFEGTKILVYKALLKDVLNQETLDPHFSESEKFLSPIARFVPTQEGSEMSQRFCELYLS